ncbi:LysR family transcriptional regulator [Chelatococcus reniformis]|uniref:Transcriptional regulator n=1 Tax=Chelatococcus reniformis TaxID=1494448 RepID=A0A916U556_9HYPH|nr:LysR family transcriptional regulator [Chelatococcus reniformis]GGC61115.1 transcriptional regulator [Chelatococcus reniformis]
MDRLTSLTVFTRVVEAGGFSAAARRLNMSVTMVSSHVQALEQHLGARLLNRTTRKVSPTEIGHAYYERASQILAELDDADRLVGALHATPRGLLRVYTSMHLLRFLSPVVDEFLTLYPAVALDLTVGDRMVDLIEEGFDLAIRTIVPADSSLIVRRLTPWRHVLACAPSYLKTHPAPQVPADLAHHNCLRYTFYPFGDEWRLEGPDGTLNAVKVSGNLVTNSAETLRYLAVKGRGLFLAPTFMIADDIAAGTLVRLMPQYRPQEFAINALYPHRHNLSTKVRSFLDLVAERFAEHRRWMNPDEG